MGAADVQGLVAGIYHAALEPELWQVVVPRLLDALGCQRGVIGIATDGRSEVDVAVSVGIDPEGTRRWRDEFGGFDPFFDSLGRRTDRAGATVRPYTLVDPEVVRRTEVYRALFGPGGIDDHLVTVLASEKGRASYFSAYRGLDEEPFGSSECELHEALATHLVLATRIHDRLHAVTRAREAGAALIERLPYALLWLDHRGRVLTMNAAAERVLARRDGLGLRCGALSALAPDAQARLDAAIGAAVAVATARGPGSAGFVRIDRAGARPPYAALVAPIPAQPREIVFGFERRAAVVAVALSDPDDERPFAADTLRTLFGLTPALARLAVAAAAGRTIREYAAETGLEVGTVRQQMKELMARTGTRRQAELVRRIVSSVARLEG
jgi:DNA-binding CsgD family transcriptional regulator